MKKTKIPVVKAASAEAATVTQPSADKKENQNTMSTNKSAPAPSTKTTANTKPTPPTGEKTATGDAKEKKEPKRPRVRWVSPKDPTFWVRSYKDVTDKHGAPMDPWGNKMEVKIGGGGGGGNLAAAREAEKAKLAAMSDEQKLAYAKDKREAKKKAKDAKKASERDALIAQLKKEIAEGKI